MTRKNNWKVTMLSHYVAEHNISSTECLGISSGYAIATILVIIYISCSAFSFVSKYDISANRYIIITSKITQWTVTKLYKGACLHVDLS